MLSKRCKYALKALLALARLPPGERLPAARLAEAHALPRQFLDRILLDLNRHGWVDSRRGPRGGHTLAVAPEALTFGQVVRALDGPLALLPCVSKTAYRRCDDCASEATCAVRGVFAEVRDAASALMDRYSLADALAAEAPAARAPRVARVAAKKPARAAKRGAAATATPRK